LNCLIDAIIKQKTAIRVWPMNEDIPGRYIHKRSRSHYIELKPDGSYVLFERGTGITGRYEISGTDIRIFGAESTSEGKIQHGIITDAEGEKWIRTGVTDDPLARMTWLPAILRRDDFPWELVDMVVIIFIALILAM
jgi:hypothetical protein